MSALSQPVTTDQPPFFVHKGQLRSLLYVTFPFAFFTVLSLAVYPIAVVGTFFWGGFGIVEGYYAIRGWRRGARSVLFYDDHLRVTTRHLSTDLSYSEIAELEGNGQFVRLSFRDKTIPTVLIKTVTPHFLGNMSRPS